MKKLTGLVVILAALVLGAYYGMGFVTQRTLNHDVNLVNQVYQQSGLSLKMADYKRGWFTSKAEFNWHFQMPQQVVEGVNGQKTVVPAQDFVVDMPIIIYHGPIIMAKGVHFGLGYASTNVQMPAKFNQQFDEMFDKSSTKPQLDMSILVNFMNKSRLTIQIPAFKLIDKKSMGTFEWMGSSSDVSLSSKVDRVVGDLRVNGLKFIKGNNNVTVGAIDLYSKLTKDKLGLYTGKVKFSFPSLEVVENNKKIFDLEDFSFQVSSNVDSDLFNSSFKTDLAKVVVQEKSYGPASLKVSVKNLDAKVLSRINQASNNLQNGTKEERQRALIGMIPELPQLFNKGAEFEVSEMSVVLPQGTIEGSLLVGLPKTDVSNPFEMMKNVKGDGKLQVPSVLVKTFMQQGIKSRLEQTAKAQQPAVASTTAVAAPTSNQATTAATTTPAVTTTPAEGTASADLEQQASAQMEQKISALLQAGVIEEKNSNFIITMKLENGQFTVNGKPFNASMLQY